MSAKMSIGVTLRMATDAIAWMDVLAAVSAGLKVLLERVGRVDCQQIRGAWSGRRRNRRRGIAVGRAEGACG